MMKGYGRGHNKRHGVLCTVEGVVEGIVDVC